jgi:hypothetical protein
VEIPAAPGTVRHAPEIERTLHACFHCSIRGLDVFYLPASARWICPDCGGAVSYPFLLRAADLREAQAVTRYRQATREP